MNNFNELATFIDKEEIRQSLPEQHYITLMEHMSNLREEIETLNPPKELYRLKIVWFLPHIALSSDNEYEIVKEELWKTIIFDRKNITCGIGTETDYDLRTCIDAYVGNGCSMLPNGKIILDMDEIEDTCFRLHTQSCDDKGNDDCDNDSCPWLKHSYKKSKLIGWEKL